MQYGEFCLRGQQFLTEGHEVEEQLLICRLNGEGSAPRKSSHHAVSNETAQAKAEVGRQGGSHT